MERKVYNQSFYVISTPEDCQIKDKVTDIVLAEAKANQQTIFQAIGDVVVITSELAKIRPF